MKFLGFPETLKHILEKWCLTRHCFLQRRCPKGTYLVLLMFAAGFSTKQFAKMLCVFLKPTLHRLSCCDHEEFHFCFPHKKKKETVKKLERFFLFLQKEMKTL